MRMLYIFCAIFIIISLYVYTSLLKYACYSSKGRLFLDELFPCGVESSPKDQNKIKNI